MLDAAWRGGGALQGCGADSPQIKVSSERVLTVIRGRAAFEPKNVADIFGPSGSNIRNAKEKSGAHTVAILRSAQVVEIIGTPSAFVACLCIAVPCRTRSELRGRGSRLNCVPEDVSA